ncbi:hypothetical protein DYH09_22600, partial [bacterium CPR1]|nr:hypothetical protein [bacterium CPR1]
MADREALHRLEPEGTLVELARGTFEQFSLSRDGSQLVYLRPDADGCQLRVIDFHTGSDRLVKHSSGEARVYDYPEYRRPTFTPDGSRILYAVTSLDGSWGAPLHNAIVMPYVETYGTEEQKRRWLPRLVSGELIGAIAMTEPGAGSDLQGIRTSARKTGNQYAINGD